MQQKPGADTQRFTKATMTTTDWMRRQRLPTLIARLQLLYRYRELIRNLVVSDLKARYKNSMLGFVWTLLNPLAMMLVFTVVFSFLSPNQQIEKYPLFLLCGLLPWNFFADSLGASVNSLVGNANLIKKVYFPREVLPIASVLAQLVNFLLAFLLLFIALLVFRAQFSSWLWLLPLVILIQTCFTVGIALILSTLNVFFRDTVIVLNVVILAWFFLTPVFYAVTLLPVSYTLWGIPLNLQRLFYILNPLASLINMYRDLLYWGYRTDLDFFLRTAVTALLVLWFGYWLFNRYSDRFGEAL
jgi:lipopolysaccharide transport system permease protein